MNAQILEASFLPMQATQLADVMSIENASYPWPWSEGNIRDSIAQGYCCQRLQQGEQLLGYFIAMVGVDEVHLLNITVAPAHRGQGWARVMLDTLCDWARECKAHWVWLEVRVSNARALAVYEAYGFRRIALRKAYYPHEGAQREDAVVMNKAVLL